MYKYLSTSCYEHESTCGNFVLTFLVGVGSAWIVDEVTPHSIFQVGNDTFKVSWHRTVDFNGLEHKEFILESVFNHQPIHSMKFKDDGTFFLDGKAVCFSDGTSSDGGICPFSLREATATATLKRNMSA